MQKLGLTLVSLVLAACAGGSNPDEQAAARTPGNQKVGESQVSIIAGSESLRFADGRLVGTGAVRATQSLADVETATNYQVVFSLAPGGSVTLVSHSQSNLTGGVEVTFQRPTSGAALRVTARASDREVDWSSRFSSVNVASEIRLSVDVHNDHGPRAHVLIWNSSDERPLVSAMVFGRGSGSWFGLLLRDAEVANLSAGEARDQH